MAALAPLRPYAGLHRFLCAPALHVPQRSCSSFAELALATRRKDEREDSLSEAIRADRAMHALRIENAEAHPSTLALIKKLKLGRAKGWHDQKRATQLKAKLKARLSHLAVEIGKTGGLTADDLVKGNRNGLPEVAILGHSNCGKSTLLNALIGMRPRTGLAEVNTRAGWTMRLHFYWVRPRGLLDSAVAGSERGAVLVDTPGYGHAVGEKAELRHWRSLIEAYVDGSSSLQLGLLLVDSTRGLCDADGRVLRLLRKRRVPTLVALTKCDLLTPDELARSHAVVQAQVDEALQGGEGGIGSDVPLLLLSSHFYGGVERLWEELAARLQPTAAQGYKAGGRPGGPWDVGGRGGGEHEVEEVAASRGS